MDSEIKRTVAPLFKSNVFVFVVQGHLPHQPQLPAGLHPGWPQEADCRVRLQSDRTSSSAALHQTPPGQPDVPVTLLCLTKHTQEQVGMNYSQKVSEHLVIKGIDLHFGKYISLGQHKDCKWESS